MYPTLLLLGPVRIGSYGVLLALAFLAGAFVIWKKAREEHFEEEDIFDAVLIATFWGMVGARILYVFLHPADFGSSLVKMIALTRFPGMAFLGALPLAALGLAYFVKKKKWDFIEVADIFVVGLALAQSIGQFGLFLNGGGYGNRARLPWAVSFPGVEGPRHPTQIYGALLFLILFVVLNRFVSRYRIYAWYKGEAGQAKPGLALGTYGFGLGVILLFLGNMKPALIYLRLVSIEVWLGGLLAPASLFWLYLRSGRQLKADVEMIKDKLGKKLLNRRKSRRKRSRLVTAGKDVK